MSRSTCFCQHSLRTGKCARIMFEKRDQNRPTEADEILHRLHIPCKNVTSLQLPNKIETKVHAKRIPKAVLMHITVML